MQDGVCVTPTLWLELMGVLCRREQSSSQGLISLAPGAGLGREDVIWAMPCEVTGRCELASEAAGALSSLSWSQPWTTGLERRVLLVTAGGTHLLKSCVLLCTTKRAHGSGVSVFGSGLLWGCPPQGLYHPSARRQQPWQGCDGLGIISQCVLSV